MFLRPNVILNAASRVATTQRTNMVRMATPSMLRMYATLPREDVQSRVLDVVKSFDKVDGSKVIINVFFKLRGGGEDRQQEKTDVEGINGS